MFTTCPQCALNLALTVNDLRLGQGYVRCGRCNSVFNALLALSEEGDASTAESAEPTQSRPLLKFDEPEGGEPQPADPPTREPDAPPAAPEPEPESEPEPKPPAEAPPKVAPPAQSTALLESLPAPAPGSHDPVDDIPLEEIDPNEATGEVEVLRTGTFETIVLEGEGILQTEETVTESEVDAQLQALVQRFDAVRENEEASRNALWPPAEEIGEPEFDLADEEEAPPLSAAQRQEFELGEPEEALAPEIASLRDALATQPPAEPALKFNSLAADMLAVEDALGVGPPVRHAPRLIRWVAGCAVLVLALAAQLVHHYREALVSMPAFSAPMTRLYHMFNVVLEPRWDLQAYDVRQLGADAVPGDTPHIAVRASIHNRAAISQPAPLLRVVLQDRYGNQIATREVAPLEYLRGASLPRLAADQRVDAELLLPDPGQAAVGFEIDACLRSASGVLRCASDPAPH